ncbi:YdcF family protein [Micromonospora echinofusca]|uniref:YdcF family protein n=1 Tax=Micromonospora echinofusca TaxID=47858 RepID=A0ABS3VJZ2_MICEH|nr:YdcF family protein [Micromonospora echinofusca]MBO4204840.1 YdcF family protein [Micromonospora echinofusca]
MTREYCCGREEATTDTDGTPTALTLLVFGCGLERRADGWALTAAGTARVEAAVRYAHTHAAAFGAAAARGRTPRVVFTGGWPGGCAEADVPPRGSGEGDLMCRQARAAGLDRYAELHREARSTSTLENLLYVREDGLPADSVFDAAHPLGLVSHAWHLPRVRFLATRALRLPGTAMLDIPVAGPAGPDARWSPRLLLAAARVAHLGARDAAMLLRRERRLLALVRGGERLVARLGSRPGRSHHDST